MVYRVILADDHPVVLRGIHLAITRGGDAVVVGEAASPETLLECIASTACDAVVTDFSMPGPGSDGLALLEEVHRRHPGLPVMVVTTLANPALYREILATGVRGLVAKSGDARDIVDGLREIVAGRRYLGASVRALVPVADDAAEARPGKSGTLASLSPREHAVLRLFASGNSVTDIARSTGRGLSTVSQQKTSAMRKLSLVTDAEIFEYIDRLR